MERNFFIGSVGKPGDGYDDENWKRCITLNAHVMHEDTKQKGVFDKVKTNDICFLKYKDMIIAFGEVSDVCISEDKTLNGWTYLIKVYEWYFYSTDKKSGVSKYGISEHTYTTSQMATVKQLYPDFSLSKMKEIAGEDNILYKKINNEIIMSKYSVQKQKVIDKLIKNGNLILTGAPGTGKTFTAKEIAKSLGAEGERCGFVQFHPSYDYTDFVEGLRPVKNADSKEIGFERKDGTFMAFCRQALKAYKEAQKQNAEAPKYVFIIDEINRGEISKIFGELFFSIDPGYRGKKGKIATQYANLWTEEYDDDKQFYISENVYIIGTMNDIDRSVESMDFAMRRRFAWKEVTADSSQSMFDSDEAWKGNMPAPEIIKEVKERMNNLNLCILTIQGLGSSYQIGAAYFLKLLNYMDNGEATAESWEMLWENHIYGLLFEYLRGNPDQTDQLKALEKAYKLAEIYTKNDDKVTQVNSSENE